MDIELNMKIKDGDLEVRFGETNKAWELIAWIRDDNRIKPYCIVIAFFRKDSEGYYMETVGERFFEYESFSIAKKAMKILNAMEGYYE